MGNGISKLKFVGIFMGIAAFLVLGWVFFTIVSSTSAAQISSIEIDQPNLVIRGQNLDRVEIWGRLETPSANPVKLGDADRVLTRGRGALWVYRVSDIGQLFPDIFARGYDDEKLVGEVHLSEEDQTFLESIWRSN